MPGQDARDWTVREVLAWTTGRFRELGLASPRLNAELLLAAALKLPARLDLLLDPDRRLTEAERAACRELVRRRAAREPAAHILGSWSFYGRSFLAGPQALVPRPETELVAERAVALARAAAGARSALDLGTGCGCLAVTLALEVPELRVVATDVSEAALELARRNAERLDAAERVEFLVGDLFAALPAGAEPFDLVVSNPPYVPSAEIDGLMPEVARFEPRLALDGGADGLDFYRRLAAECARWLRPGGAVVLELGAGEAAAVRALFEQAGAYAELEAIKDFAGHERVFTAQRA